MRTLIVDHEPRARATLRQLCEADESIDNGPTGGLTWDGRVDRGSDQARIPLLSPFENNVTSTW